MIPYHYKRILCMPAALLSFAVSVPANAAGTAAEQLSNFQRLIEQQQKSLEALQQQIKELKAATESNAAAVAKSQDDVKQAISKVEQTATPSKMVSSGNDKVHLAISGQINRGIMVVDDGAVSQVHHVDVDTSSTRVRFVGTAEPNEDITIGARLEVQLEVNSSANIVQGADTQTGGTSFNTRYADLSVASKRFGKIYLGQGDTASNTMAEQDLSGTNLIVYSDFGIYGSLLFKNANGGASSGVSIANAMSNFDGESRKSRFRYDTPRFSGLQGRVGHMEGDKSDLGIHYSGAFGGTKIAAMAGYVNDASASGTVDSKYGGSASVLFENGISLTGLYTGQEFTTGRSDANTLYGKLGYRAQMIEAGETRIAVEYGQTDNLAANDDEASIWGGGIVQVVDDWSTEAFAGFRVHDFERTGTNVDDIAVGMAGLRVKF